MREGTQKNNVFLVVETLGGGGVKHHEPLRNKNPCFIKGKIGKQLK